MLPRINDKAYPLGVPKYVIKTPHNAFIDDLLLVVVDGRINLPKIEKRNIGQCISVCNLSDNDDSVYVSASDALIGRNLTVYIPKNTVYTFVAVAPFLWTFSGEQGARWDDLRFPAQGINLPGAASDPTRDTTTGLLNFAKSAQNSVVGIAQLPHSWKAGTGVRPHIHHRALTDPGGTGDVVWKLEYKWYNNHATVPASYTSDTQIFTLSDFSGGLQIADIHSFTEIDGTGMRDSSIIEWKLSRMGADASDNYNDYDVLLEFDIHYLKNSYGSFIEYPGA